MDHRKYHWLYFLLGVMIAVIVATLMGCKPAETTGGIYEPTPPPPPGFCENGTLEWDLVEEDWMCKMVIID